jgi:hypothetical protein
MKRLIISAAVLTGIGVLLAGCETDGVTGPPVATISGPHFSASRFDCGTEPLPPDPVKAGTAKAGAKYESHLRGWGRGCNNNLTSVGHELSANGLVK